MRAGAYALSLLAMPLNVHVLQALAEGPSSLIDLRRAAGSPPQTTMRGHLRTLTKLEVLERRRQGEFPGSVDYQLGPAGHDLVGVVEVLQGWLSHSPDGPLQPGSVAARSAIKALVEGWSSAIVRAIAAKPLSLTELNRLISSLNYPSLDRRLAAMRLTKLIEPRPSGGRSTPYAATEWLRRAIAPLAAAACWERRHAPAESTPIGRLDIESAFLLGVPMLRVSPELSGVCRLAVDIPSPEEHRFAGVLAGVKEGRVIACVSRLEGRADAWATASVAAWMRAVKGREAAELEVGGEVELANALVADMHGALFGVRQQR